VNRNGRLARLRAALTAKELPALLVTAEANVRYLSGFTGSNGTLVIDAERALLLTDFRYLAQAAQQAPQFEIVDGGSEPRRRIAELLTGVEPAGFDDADMRVKAHAALLEAIDGAVELVPAAGVVEALRAVKDEEEIAAIARAAALGDSIYVALAEEGLVGCSEREIAWRIEVLAHDLGADGLSFPPIVAAGPHGALAHAEPRDHEVVANELVVLDLGVVLDGYCSDCTRTFATGRIPEAQAEAYQLVLTAQEKALAAVRPGASCRDVDALAREEIARAGMGERFGHSLGHGVGVEVHELPTLSTRSEDELAVGNVVTVEPGVYVDGEFGVRIEDLVVVTETGSRVLTPFPKELTLTG
jgi:Xaa-Pro aminopeptidase